MPSAPPSILGGSYEQQAAYQSSVPPQPSAAPEPLAASHSSAAPQSGLIGENLLFRHNWLILSLELFFLTVNVQISFWLIQKS